MTEKIEVNHVGDDNSDYLLRVEGLKKYFPIKTGLFNKTTGHVKAVDDISFNIRKGETFGIVGESGSGKTTLGRTILRLLDPTEGKIIFNGKDMAELKQTELRRTRKDMQMVFQDPYSSLNPRMRVEELIEEPMIIHSDDPQDVRKKRVKKLLDTVGLSGDAARKYPHEFSGGQRQRIGIARALAINPKLIIADEPVSALDVSVQSQVLNLLSDLQEEFNLTYLFIAHDLSVVKHISDRIGVMYLGKMMELGPKDTLYEKPLHPYTEALFSAIPIPDPHQEKERIILEGDIPSPSNPPTGCVFQTRCPYAFDKCRIETPIQKEVDGERLVSCHLYEDAQ